MNFPREIIPDKGDLTTEQHVLMLRMNALVKDLFERQPGIRPDSILNRSEECYTALLRVQLYPEERVGYELSDEADISLDDGIWMNFRFILNINDKRVPLTPKQTYWMCSQLQDVEEITSAIRDLTGKYAQKIREYADELNASANDMFQTHIKKNHMFDTAIDGHDVNIYTNYPYILKRGGLDFPVARRKEDVINPYAGVDHRMVIGGTMEALHTIAQEYPQFGTAIDTLVHQLVELKDSRSITGGFEVNVQLERIAQQLTALGSPKAEEVKTLQYALFCTV